VGLKQLLVVFLVPQGPGGVEKGKRMEKGDLFGRENHLKPRGEGGGDLGRERV